MSSHTLFTAGANCGCVFTSLYLCRYSLRGSPYSSKPRMPIAHTKSSPFIVFRFSRWHLSLALHQQEAVSRLYLVMLPCMAVPNSSCRWHMASTDVQQPSSLPLGRTHSLVMKLINSETHSCTVSLASLAIFAFAGSAFFIILLMFAMGRNRSCSLMLPPRSSPSSLSRSAPLLLMAPVCRQCFLYNLVAPPVDRPCMSPRCRTFPFRGFAHTARLVHIKKMNAPICRIVRGYAGVP